MSKLRHPSSDTGARDLLEQGCRPFGAGQEGGEVGSVHGGGAPGDGHARSRAADAPVHPRPARARVGGAGPPPTATVGRV